MKRAKNNVLDMLNKSKGLNRGRYVRQRSAVFADKTKYNRREFKRIEME